MKPGVFSLRIRFAAIHLFFVMGFVLPSVSSPSVRATQLHRQIDPAAQLGSIGGCPMFPANNIWNVPVSTLPVHARSNQWIDSIGRNNGFHMDFGSGTWDGGPIGIPYNVVGAGVPKVAVSFYYPSESDPGPYPIPFNPKIEYGSDHHILIVDSSTCTLYELYDASYSGGQWHAGSGALWNLNSNVLRPDTWTSADAAGLPILPGLVRYEEVLSGKIDHAIRFTASHTNGYIWPARHLTSDDPSAPYIPPMGARFRLKASFNISAYPPHMRVILNAMKTYGIILADNGSDWYISGAPDNRWDNDMLHLLDDLTGDDFEAVDTSGLIVNTNSGATGFMISGNTGIGGVTLNYTDGTPKTGISDGSGNYSLFVSYNWSGRVTPTKAGYSFSPASRAYSSVLADRTGQNYSPLVTISGNAAIAGVTLSYADGGPKTATTLADGSYALLVSYNWLGTVTPSHPCFTFTPLNRSYSNLITSQTGQSFTAAFNAAPGCADIDVRVGGVDQGNYGLLPGDSTRTSLANLNAGPVQILSSNGIPLISAERVIYKINNLNTSFSEMIGLPESQVDTTYWLPWYNNVDLDTQLRIANVGGGTANVNIFIGGSKVTATPIMLAAGASTRVSYAGVNNGPVKIESDQPIVAAERVIYKVNNVNTSFSEMMALPDSQLDTTYWLPWYNNASASGLDTQLRIANVSEATAQVHVYIGGAEVTTTPITLLTGQSTRVSYAGTNNGPVKIDSDQPIVAAERVIYKVNNLNTSFSEMMGLPDSQLDTVYWLPWYNNADLDTQLRFANAGSSQATVHIYIGGQEVQDSPFTLAVGESTRKNFAGANSGPVKIQSDQPIVAAERVIYKINNVPVSFSEMMGLAEAQLDTSYWLPWYNNIDLDTQLRFGVP